MLHLSIRKYALSLGISHTAVSKAIRAGHICKGWDMKQKKILVEYADNEWGNGIKEKINLKGNATINNPIVESLDLTTLMSENEYRLSIRENITFSEARRKKEIYIAEISRIAALKEQGVYVEKAKVYSTLFNFGQSLRVAFQAIPDRIVDRVLSAKTRTEAHSIILSAIDEALGMLTKSPAL